MDQLEPNIMRDSMHSTVRRFPIRQGCSCRQKGLTVFCFLNYYVSDLLIFNISSNSRLLIFLKNLQQHAPFCEIGNCDI
jgi:hypothetical protein